MAYTNTGMMPAFTEYHIKGDDIIIQMVAVKVTPWHLDPGDFEIPVDYHISDVTSFLERE